MCVPSTKRLILSLQGLRGLCYCLIFAGHVQFLWGWPAFGVSVFMVMSGFLMMLHHGQGHDGLSWKSSFFFAAARIRKIYGLHVLTTGGIFLLYACMGGMPAVREHVASLLLNLLLVQAWVPDTHIAISLNGVNWYLSAALFAYFCFPWLQGCISRLRSGQGIAAALAAVLLAQVCFAMLMAWLEGRNSDVFVWSMYLFPMFRLGDFTAGCLAGYWFACCGGRHMLETAGRKWIAAAWLAAAAVLYIAMKFIQPEPVGIAAMALQNWSTGYIVPALMLVILAAGGRGMAAKILGCRILAGLGNISAFTYLLHSTVILCSGVMMQSAGIVAEGWQRYALWGAEFGLTCVLAAGYSHLQQYRKG